MMKRFMLFITLLLFSLSFIGCTVTPKFSDSKDISKLKQIPSFNMKDMNDNTITQKIFQSSTLTLINIWGTSCGPCLDEMPILQNVYENMKDEKINVLGIVIDGKANDVEALQILQKKKITYPNVIPNESFYKDFLKNFDRIPISFVVDSNGNILGKIMVGDQDQKTFEKMIQKGLDDLKK